MISRVAPAVRHFENEENIVRAWMFLAHHVHLQNGIKNVVQNALKIKYQFHHADVFRHVEA